MECWPRGGGKSTTVELIVTYIGSMDRPARNFALYVSDTQEQADKHVQSISTNLQEMGVERALSKYGYSKGWRANTLRCANGFNVIALGLDTAARGIKLDNFRPDIIIFDDVDSDEDTQKTIEKKLRAIRKKILAAGSVNCAVLFIQNMISDRGIMHSLVKGTATWLLDRNVGEVEPAVWDLEVQRVEVEGKSLWKIVAGIASWAGQSLKVCEKQINDWGLDVFSVESQHEVDDPDDLKPFKPWMLTDRFLKPEECPKLTQWYRGWDTATEDQEVHDFTATARIAYDDHLNLYIRGFKKVKLNPSKLLEWAEPIIENHPTDMQIPEAHNMGYGIFGFIQRKGDPWKMLCHLQKATARQGGKLKRAGPLSFLMNERKVYIVMEGDWEDFLTELWGFTGLKGTVEQDDLIDAVTTPMMFLKESASPNENKPQQSEHVKRLKKLIKG